MNDARPSGRPPLSGGGHACRETERQRERERQRESERGADKQDRAKDSRALRGSPLFGGLRGWREREREGSLAQVGNRLEPLIAKFRVQEVEAAPCS